MQRFQGLNDESATGVAKLAIDGNAELMGRTAELIRIVANHAPHMAAWLVGFVSAVRQPNFGAETEMRLRGLACIKTSMVNQCDYCMAHTSILGQALGFSDDELAQVQDGAYADSELFSEREKAAIAWADAVTHNTAARDKPLWERMQSLFTPTEIVEITMNSAMFNMINRLNDTFWTELEPLEYNNRQGKALTGLSLDDLSAYAGRLAQVGQAAHRRDP